MSMFRVFFQEEAVVVCTSNRAPHELNDNAWFQEHYDKFVELFHDRCDIVNLQTVDYRRKALRTAQAGSKEGTHVLPYFFHPATGESVWTLPDDMPQALTPDMFGPWTLKKSIFFTPRPQKINIFHS